MEKKRKIIDLEDLNQVFSLFRKNWLILVFLPLFFLAIGYFYAYKLPNIYAASSQVLVKSDEVYDYQTNIYRSLGYYGNYENLTNQIRVIQSRDLIETTLSKLNFEISYYLSGRLKTSELFRNVPFEVKVKVMNPKIYEQPVYLKFINEDEYELTYERGDETIKLVFSFGEDYVNKDFSINISKTKIVNSSTIESLKSADYHFEIHHPKAMMNKYLTNLKVENEEYTSILNLTVEDEIPARAVTFLDTLANVYIDNTLQSKFAINKNTLTYIDRQLNEVIGILSQIEDTLENYKSEKAILDLQREESEYFKRYIDFDMQRRELKLRLEALRALEDYVLKINTQQETFLPSSYYVFSDDDFLGKFIEKLYNLQIKKNNAMNTSTKDNQSVQSIVDEINLIRQNIIEYINNSEKALLERINGLKTEINQYQSIIKGIPKTQRDMLNITRRLQVNEKLYLFLLEKRANTIIARAGIVPQTKVIEMARSQGVVKPDKQKIYFVFGSVGIGLAFAIAFVRFLFFNKIESLGELSQATSLPVLGQVFFLKDKDKDYELVDLKSKSPLTESFRTIRTNLQYFSSERKKKVILNTSIGPSEGKTFCSTNLALVHAKAGKKTLLVDLDMHKPKLHRAFNLDRKNGMSNYLIKKAEFKDIVHEGMAENLDVITSGPVPPNASELILSQRLEDFIDYVKKQYDYIVIDTPPLGLISDSMLLMKYTDVSIFILNTKYSRTQEVSFIEDLVEKNKLKNIAIILNGVKTKRWKYYYGRYSYRYGYGYGYQYGQKPEKQ